MTSVERVTEYVDLKPEEPGNIENLVNLSVQWPIGAIVFDNLSFRYSSTAPWVLKNLNLSIQTNEKVLFYSINQNKVKFLVDFRLVSLVEQVLEKVQ
jgi:ABC-type multidrug transport system fused ATPase/permease subunit